MNWLTRDRTLEEFAGADTIDTMELDERLSEINDLLEEDDNAIDEGQRDGTLLREERADLEAERKKIEDILNYVEGYGDRQNVLYLDGEPFIRHAQDFAEDIGAIDRNANWPATHIDWEAAAEALQQDYTSVDIEGRTYWFR